MSLSEEKKNTIIVFTTLHDMIRFVQDYIRGNINKKIEQQQQI